MANWHLVASGDSDDPAVHHHLLERVRELFAIPEFGTGSSEFVSPHASLANFHTTTGTPPVATPPAAPAPDTSSGTPDQAVGSDPLT